MVKKRHTTAMTRRHGIATIFGGILFARIPGFSQPEDPLIGTWLLDRRKSDFTPYFPLQRRTMIITANDNGIKCVIRTVSDRQETTEVTFSAHYDGKDVPIESSALDTVSLRRTGSDTIERTGKIHGAVVEMAVMKLSADGKVLTMQTEGTTPKGDSYKSTQVFTRQ